MSRKQKPKVGWRCEACGKVEIVEGKKPPNWTQKDAEMGWYEHLKWEPMIVEGFDFGRSRSCGRVKRSTIETSVCLNSGW